MIKGQNTLKKSGFQDMGFVPVHQYLFLNLSLHQTLFEKPNLGRDILALKLFEYYYHPHMQENWIDSFKATKSMGCQEMGRGKAVKFKQTRLKAVPL